MPSRLLLPLALAALIALSAPSAAADCCASPVVEPHHRHHVKRHRVKPFYIVDQGPVYGGPSIETTPRIEYFHVPPANYPRVRETYYYPTYRDSYSVPPWHQPWQRGHE